MINANRAISRILYRFYVIKAVAAINLIKPLPA